MRPARPPIGLHLTSAARIVGRAFDDALGEAEGSLPVWLVSVNLKRNSRANQREIAEAMGISEATLTHHLNAMEADGLVTRHRDPTNRRVHLIQLTDAGEAAFVRLRDAASTFDRRLRRGLGQDEVDQLHDLLTRLAANVGASIDHGPPWRGLVEGRTATTPRTRKGKS
ncbi:MAG TPA: MarR family transcriptional regulator [Acidimicrobiales bacterium]|nr:MarR family transcriptional regulator [Acidimicrobiales bacterium]